MTYQTSSQVYQSQAFNCSGCPNFTSFNGSRGRGLCQYRDQVVFEHHQSTNECLYSLEKESKQYLQSFDQPEDVPYCEFQPGQLVKVIDLDEPDHNEWATFKIFTKIINYKRFSSSGSYLEPDWLILLSSLARDGGEMFWVAENEICHVNQSHIIDTSDVF